MKLKPYPDPHGHPVRGRFQLTEPFIGGLADLEKVVCEHMRADRVFRLNCCADRGRVLHRLFPKLYAKWRPWQFEVINYSDNWCEFAWVETDDRTKRY